MAKQTTTAKKEENYKLEQYLLIEFFNSCKQN